MAHFAFDDSVVPVRTNIGDAQRNAWQWLAQPGSWWSGEQHVALARVLRDARAQRSRPPWLRDQAPPSEDSLPAAAIEVARRVANDAHQLDRAWADQMVQELGDAAYVEVVAVVAIVTAIDAFAEAIGASTR